MILGAFHGWPGRKERLWEEWRLYNDVWLDEERDLIISILIRGRREAEGEGGRVVARPFIYIFCMIEML